MHLDTAGWMAGRRKGETELRRANRRGWQNENWPTLSRPHLIPLRAFRADLDTERDEAPRLADIGKISRIPAGRKPSSSSFFLIVVLSLRVHRRMGNHVVTVSLPCRVFGIPVRPSWRRINADTPTGLFGEVFIFYGTNNPAQPPNVVVPTNLRERIYDADTLDHACTRLTADRDYRESKLFAVSRHSRRSLIYTLRRDVKRDVIKIVGIKSRTRARNERSIPAIFLAPIARGTCSPIIRLVDIR
jgi:hypothetical protein